MLIAAAHRVRGRGPLAMRFTVSIVRIGMGENKKYGEGFAAIFGKKKGAKATAKPAAKPAAKPVQAAAKPAAKKAPAKKK